MDAKLQQCPFFALLIFRICKIKLLQCSEPTHILSMNSHHFNFNQQGNPDARNRSALPHDVSTTRMFQLPTSLEKVYFDQEYRPQSKVQTKKKRKSVKFSISNDQDDNFLQYLARNGKKKKIESPKHIKTQIKLSREESIEKETQFKKTIHKYKISNIITKFLSKLRRNMTNRQPIDYQPFEAPVQENNEKIGFELREYQLFIYIIFSTTLLFTQNLLSSLLLFFDPVNISVDFVLIIQVCSLIWILVQIMFGFILVREKESFKVTKIKQISQDYAKSQFILDIIYLLACISQLLKISSGYRAIFHLFSFVKIPHGIRQLKKIQNKLIKSREHQQYYQVFKLVMKNFFLAHIVSILLLLMSNLSQNNWLSEKGLTEVQWSEKYCWAYYWATTTMLSVGFGDFSATNYKQAIVLVLIQIFSCLFLAYNINLIGSLLQDMRQKDLEEEKKLKILNGLCNQNQIDRQLEFRLKSHVKQSCKAEQKFKFEQNSLFISKLPINLKQQFLKEVNKKVIQKISFFKNFTNRAIIEISKKIEHKMLHPWEIAFKQEQKDLILLKQGNVGLCPNFHSTRHQHIIIDSLAVNEKEDAIILSLNFLKNNTVTQNYDYKSIGYSIIGRISLQNFIDILKQKNTNSQFFYTFRDKQNHQRVSFQPIYCSNCKDNHSKFGCPRLHFCPITELVVLKYLSKLKRSKSIRKWFCRYKIQHKPFALFNKTDFFLNEDEFACSSKCIVESEKELRRKKSSSHLLKQNKMLISQPFESKIKNYLQDVTADLKKCVIEMVVEEKKKSDFWTIDSDVAQNYSFYFNEDNPEKLQKLELRKGKNNGKKPLKTSKKNPYLK